MEPKYNASCEFGALRFGACEEVHLESLDLHPLVLFILVSLKFKVT